jgi:hypothetical protein
VKPKELYRIIAGKKERLKELACINRTTQILKEGKAIDETLSQVFNTINGKIDTIKDIIIAKQENFDRTKTREMVRKEYRSLPGITICR